jgi:serine/threonine protein kinase
MIAAEMSNDPPAVERFPREARVASALNHPSICTIHDIGEHEGQHYIVMERLEGETLKHHVSAARLDVDQIVDVGIQVADALDAAQTKAGSTSYHLALPRRIRSFGRSRPAIHG